MPALFDEPLWDAPRFDPNLQLRSEADLNRAIEEAKARLSGLEWEDPPVPQPPVISPGTSPAVVLRKLERFIRSLEYNHVGGEFFRIEKNRPLCRVMEMAKLIIREALPIKCLEAVVVGLYLTKDMPDMLRFPLRFKSKVKGHSFWHIVLAVRAEGKFGALGLSRRPTLDFRELKYGSLSELVQSYREGYEEVGHTLKKITVGLPLGRNETSNEQVFWHFLMISISRDPTCWEHVNALLDRYMKSCSKLEEHMRRSGVCHPLEQTVYRDMQLHFVMPGSNSTPPGSAPPVPSVPHPTLKAPIKAGGMSPLSPRGRQLGQLGVLPLGAAAVEQSQDVDAASSSSSGSGSDSERNPTLTETLITRRSQKNTLILPLERVPKVLMSRARSTGRYPVKPSVSSVRSSSNARSRGFSHFRRQVASTAPAPPRCADGKFDAARTLRRSFVGV